RADDVERKEARVAHLADAGDERREGANDGHEARDDDGLSAVALVEILRANEVLLVEEERTLAAKNFRADAGPNGVVGRVAENGRDDQEGDDQGDVYRRVLMRSQRADRKKQGVARKERRHDEPGLAEDDEKERHVEPRAERSPPFVQVVTEVRDDVPKAQDEF